VVQQLSQQRAVAGSTHDQVQREQCDRNRHHTVAERLQPAPLHLGLMYRPRLRHIGAGGGALWPGAMISELDTFLPDFEVRERHSISISGPPVQVSAATGG
jgi:hypothetical protein